MIRKDLEIRKRVGIFVSNKIAKPLTIETKPQL